MKTPRLFLIILQSFSNLKIPEHLKINKRQALPNSEFVDSDLLYRSFVKSDLDENGYLKLETIRFPDLSCNWARFSKPEDIWYRENGSVKNGCYAFSVKESRYDNIATPVHDPIELSGNSCIENYSHTEVRVLKQGQSFLDDIPKDQRLTNKTKKIEYRQNIQKVSKILIKAL